MERQISARRLWVLVQGLPPEAATWRSQAWTPTIELLAKIAELVDQWSRVIAVPVTGAKHVMVPAPLELVRPGEEPERKQMVSDPAEIRRWFAARSRPEGG